MVRFTDRADMALEVYPGRKKTPQQQQKTLTKVIIRQDRCNVANEIKMRSDIP